MTTFDRNIHAIHLSAEKFARFEQLEAEAEEQSERMYNQFPKWGYETAEDWLNAKLFEIVSELDNEPVVLEVKVVRTVGSNEFDYQRFEHLVQIRGVDKLTPKTARQAIAIAFGSTGNASVYDMHAGYGYRVYGSSARKVHMEE